MFTKQDIELAWAAGFFDGEGCISLAKNNNSVYAALSIPQIDTEVLERFKEATKCQSKIETHQPTNKEHKLQYRLRVRSQPEVKRILNLLWPYLGSVKKNQAERCLQQSTYVGKQEFCINGHKRTKENVYASGSCKICVKKARLKRYYEKERECKGKKGN